MTILNAANELNPVVAEVLVEVVYEHPSIFRLQVAAVMGNYLSVLYCYQVTAQRQVVGFHFVAYACRLQWSSSFVHLVKVVAENCCVCYFRARRETLGDCDESSTASFACQHVHHGFVGILQRSLSAQTFYGVVSHSVAQYDNSFHCLDICY